MGITLKILKEAFERSKKAEQECCDCRLPLFMPDEIKYGRCESCWGKFCTEEERQRREFQEEDEDGYYDNLDFDRTTPYDLIKNKLDED